MKILSICGSPRKGNSEAILDKIKDILEEKGIENEMIFLREKNIKRCDGCVEYCNKNLKCKHDDDMAGIMQKMLEADGYVFVVPNYFKMPPGIFKDFIDRCSIFYTAGTDLSGKKAIVIAVGADETEGIDVCLNNICENFCKTLGIPVVAKKSFKTKSELKGNYNDFFERNKDAEKETREMVETIYKSS